MTLSEVKELLNNNHIKFNQSEFENQKEFLNHISAFQYTKYSNPNKIIVLIIESNNGHTNIELEFEYDNNGFIFIDLFFGEYCCEMFDTLNNFLPEEILTCIHDFMSGKFSIITINDIKNKRWLSDMCFDLNDEEDKVNFEKRIKKIRKSKGHISKLFKFKTQYEIYDWNTYQCIIK